MKYLHLPLLLLFASCSESAHQNEIARQATPSQARCDTTGAFTGEDAPYYQVCGKVAGKYTLDRAHFHFEVNGQSYSAWGDSASYCDGYTTTYELVRPNRNYYQVFAEVDGLPADFQFFGVGHATREDILSACERKFPASKVVITGVEPFKDSLEMLMWSHSPYCGPDSLTYKQYHSSTFKLSEQ